MLDFGVIAIALFCFIFLIVVIYQSIFFVRKRHPHHVYMIWFLYSLSLVFTLFFLIVFENSNIDPPDFVIKYEPLLIHTLSDVSGEFSLMASLFILIVMPQFISYILSGIFGCGVKPQFVGALFNFVSWSVIKFFAVLAGGEAGNVIFEMTFNVESFVIVKPNFLQWIDIFTSLSLISMFHITMSFVLMSLYLNRSIVSQKFRSKSLFLNKIRLFMTRYSLKHEHK